MGQPKRVVPRDARKSTPAIGASQRRIASCSRSAAFHLQPYEGQDHCCRRCRHGHSRRSLSPPTEKGDASACSQHPSTQVPGRSDWCQPRIAPCSRSAASSLHNHCDVGTGVLVGRRKKALTLPITATERCRGNNKSGGSSLTVTRSRRALPITRAPAAAMAATIFSSRNLTAWLAIPASR